uniref:dermonecrotic toxin domain-containing protein n=1 Tax=Pandoraea pnomenusa TaxID=93220 RepID=UPI001185D32A|nr:DUF6543 domain-containing protein [Pandoraea pnomenusa]
MPRLNACPTVVPLPVASDRSRDLALPGSTVAAHPADEVNGTDILRSLYITTPHTEVLRWKSALEDVYRAHAGIRTSLPLLLSDAPMDDIAQFLEGDIDQLVDALNTFPELSHDIAASWERALAARRPYETLEEIARRVTSTRNLRSIQRSFERAATRGISSDTHDVEAPGDRWVHRVRDAFRWCLLAGSGHDPRCDGHDLAPWAHPLAQTFSAGPPLLRLERHGAVGTLTGLLYAYAGVTQIVREIGCAEPLHVCQSRQFARDLRFADAFAMEQQRWRVDRAVPRSHAKDARAASDTASGPSSPESSGATGAMALREVIGNAVDACLATLADAAGQIGQQALAYDPLRFPAADAIAPASPTLSDARSSEATAAHRIRHASHHHPSSRTGGTWSAPWEASEAVQRITALAETQTERDDARRRVSETLAPMLNLRKLLHEGLVQRLAPGKTPFDPDALYLNRFRYFVRPIHLHLPAGTFARRGLLDSITLSEAASRFFAGSDRVHDTTLAYGIYTRNVTDHPYALPSDEFADLSVDGFVAAIGLSRARWEANLGAMATSSIDAAGLTSIYECARNALEQESVLAYNAGQLSIDGLPLAQIVAYAPSAAQRSDSLDSALSHVKGYGIAIEFPGQDSPVHPAGMFAISESPSTLTRHRQRVLMVVPGSEWPLREYASMDSLLADVARGNASRLYRELVRRLPLDAQHVGAAHPPGRITFQMWHGDILQMSVQTSVDVIRRDEARSDPHRLDDRRSEEWISWLAGTATDTSATSTHDASPAETGFPHRYPPEALKRGERLTVDLRTMQQVRQLGQLRLALSAALPDIDAGAGQYMANLVDRLAGVTIDASRVYLHIYRSGMSASGQPAMSAKRRLQCVETSSLQQLMTGLASGSRQATLPAHTVAMFSMDEHPVGARPMAIGQLTPATLLAAVDVNAFINRQCDLFDAFWSQQSHDIYRSLKGAFIIESFVQAQDGRLPAPAANIAQRIAGVSQSHTLDLDGIDTPLPPPAGIEIGWLRVGTAVSDIQIFADMRSGWRLVYAPGLLPGTMAAVETQGQLHHWLLSQIRDPDSRQRLAGAFTVVDRRNANEKGISAITTPDARFPPDGLETSIVPIRGDPFQAYSQTFRARAETESRPSGSLREVGGSLATLLHWMATTNFVTGMGTFMRAPLPGMTPLHLALSMGNLFIGATSLAFEDSRIREAAVNSLVIGACGIPIGWYYTANAALRSRLQRFVTATPLGRLRELMPNLYRGEHGMVLRSGDQYFDVEYCAQERTWQMVDTGNPTTPGPQVRQNEHYEWYLDDTPAIAPASHAAQETVFHEAVNRKFLDLGYRSKLTAQRQSASLERRAAFAAGRRDAQQSPLLPSDTARPSELLKLDFVDPSLTDPRLLGILSRRIEEAERAEATLRAAMSSRIVASEIRDAGGKFTALPQSAYVNTNGDGHTGFCLPLVRLMAVARHAGREGELVAKLERAVLAPKSSEALELRQQLAKLHSNEAASVAETNLGLRDIGSLSDAIRSGPTHATYIVSTCAHSLSVMVTPDKSVFYDPNFGLAEFSRIADAVAAFAAHLQRHDLPRLYRAFDSGGVWQFSVRRVHLKALAEVDVGGKTVMEVVRAAPG